MANKNSNKTLGLVFAVLLVIVALLFVFDSGQSDRTLRSSLVDIDTSNVDKVLIRPNTTPVPLVKLLKNKDGKWRVELGDGSTAPVPKAKITNLFNQLLSIEPKTLAARDRNKWGDYRVDSTGTIVKVFEDEEKVLDMHIGRFKFQKPRMMSTFVRLTEDINVYEVEGYLAPTFTKKIDAWRDGRLIKADKGSWNRLTFNYDDGSSFTLNKISGNWTVSGGELDSTKTAKYLNELSTLTSPHFLDEVNEEELKNPTYELKIETDQGESVDIKGYKSEAEYVITSSQNKNAFFNGSKNNLGGRIFVDKERFTTE